MDGKLLEPNARYDNVVARLKIELFDGLNFPDKDAPDHVKSLAEAHNSKVLDGVIEDALSVMSKDMHPPAPIPHKERQLLRYERRAGLAGLDLGHLRNSR